MDKCKKSGRIERKNKEKSKKNKFFGSQKHIRNVESRTHIVLTNKILNHNKN